MNLFYFLTYLYIFLRNRIELEILFARFIPTQKSINAQSKVGRPMAFTVCQYVIVVDTKQNKTARCILVHFLMSAFEYIPLRLPLWTKSHTHISTDTRTRTFYFHFKYVWYIDFGWGFIWYVGHNYKHLRSQVYINLKKSSRKVRYSSIFALEWMDVWWTLCFRVGVEFSPQVAVVFQCTQTLKQWPLYIDCISC